MDRFLFSEAATDQTPRDPAVTCHHNETNHDKEELFMATNGHDTSLEISSNCRLQAPQKTI